MRLGIDDAAWGSPWRRRRVGEKVALSVGLVLTALLVPAWPGTILVTLTAVVAMLGFARIRPRLLAAAFTAPLIFLLISGVTVAIRVGGTDPGLWRLGPLSMGRDSLLRAAELFGHGVAGSLALLLLATTTPMVDVVTWLRTLRIPPELLDIASLTYRLLFVALSTSVAVHEAILARLGDRPMTRSGGRTRRDVRRQWHNLATEVTAGVLRTGHRAVRMQRGLELRGYESDLVTLPAARARSWAFIATTAVILALTWAVSFGMRWWM